MFELKVKRNHPDAKLPEVAHEGTDLGYDVFSVETVVIPAGEQKIVDTGISFEIDPVFFGNKMLHVGLIAKQPSGVATKRLLDVKAGVIDAAYRGPVKVVLYNYGDKEQIIYPKEKIAQLCPELVLTGSVIEVETLTETSRGSHGFGSGHKDLK